jgi:exopolyphosphatase/pppGpp-phosphohydrolase
VGAIDRLIATSGTAAAVVRAVGRLKKPSEATWSRRKGSPQRARSEGTVRSALGSPLSKRRGIAGIGRRRAESSCRASRYCGASSKRFRQHALTYTSAGVRDGIIANLALADFEHQQPRQQEHFHVFFCYNKTDQPKVSRIAEELTDHGLRLVR